MTDSEIFGTPNTYRMRFVKTGDACQPSCRLFTAHNDREAREQAARVCQVHGHELLSVVRVEPVGYVGRTLWNLSRACGLRE